MRVEKNGEGRFSRHEMVRATKTFGAPCAESGRRITVPFNATGMIDDDDKIIDNGKAGKHQLVHFEVGRATHCVSFPVEHLTAL